MSANWAYCSDRVESPCAELGGELLPLHQSFMRVGGDERHLDLRRAPRSHPPAL
jgi:hypothetical protein